MKRAYRAPWKWIPPPGLTTARGTAVQLGLTSPLSPLLDAGYLEAAIRRHFEPLLDPLFADLLRRHYAQGIVFEVDGQPLEYAGPVVREIVTIPIRASRSPSHRSPSVPAASTHSSRSSWRTGAVLNRGSACASEDGARGSHRARRQRPPRAPGNAPWSTQVS